jgi:hypothetical protein
MTPDPDTLIQSALERRNLLALMAALPLLRDLSPTLLEEIAREVEWFPLPGGTTLFNGGLARCRPTCRAAAARRVRRDLHRGSAPALLLRVRQPDYRTGGDPSPRVGVAVAARLGGHPGILAPVVTQAQVHVDGATINNLPVDIMRETPEARTS